MSNRLASESNLAREKSKYFSLCKKRNPTLPVDGGSIRDHCALGRPLSGSALRFKIYLFECARWVDRSSHPGFPGNIHSSQYYIHFPDLNQLAAFRRSFLVPVSPVQVVLKNYGF